MHAHTHTHTRTKAHMHMHMHMPMYMPMHMHEQVLKTTVLTVWDRNLQLAFYSMLIYGPCAQLVGRRHLGSATARRLRLLGRTRQGGTGCRAALCTPGERL